MLTTLPFPGKTLRMANRMVLSLFPGIDLLGRAFEEVGFQVVKGPDVVWGGDIRSFHINPGYFAGIIGGPPCQAHSTANKVGPGTCAVDLINEFVRVVDEGQPEFIIMENVPGAINSPYAPPEWSSVILRDWDCGGETARKRRFWSHPFPIEAPPRREGTPSLSVMASTFKRGKSTNPFVIAKSYLPGDLPVEKYGELQGFKDVAEGLASFEFNRSTIIKLLGNGVPHALGSYVASYAWEYMNELERQEQAA